MNSGILESICSAIYLLHAENKSIMEALMISSGVSKEDAESLTKQWEEALSKVFKNMDKE